MADDEELVHEVICFGSNLKSEGCGRGGNAMPDVTDSRVSVT